MTIVLQEPLALALQAAGPANVALMAASAVCVTRPAGNAPAGLELLGYAVIGASLGSGASPAAAPVTAMGTRMSVILARGPARDAGTTQQETTVRGVRLASMETRCWHPVATAGLALVLRAQGASATLPPPAIRTGTPSRWSATASLGTLAHAVKSVPPDTLGTPRGQEADANRVNAATTLTPWTLRPATVEADSVYDVYITPRGLDVPTVALGTMGRPPTRAAEGAPVTFWAQNAVSALLKTNAVVTQAVGSARACPTFRDRAVTVVPPISGTWPADEAASPVPATLAMLPVLPAMSSQGSAIAEQASEAAHAPSARRITGEILACSVGPVIVTREASRPLSATMPRDTVSVGQGWLACVVTSVPEAFLVFSLHASHAMPALGTGTGLCKA